MHNATLTTKYLVLFSLIKWYTSINPDDPMLNDVSQYVG